MGILNAARKKSPWIVHFDCNSCNGCDIETLVTLTPLYDVERFGVVNVGNPKHADVLVVTGSVNYRNARVLLNTYSQIPEPKAVVAIGACACTGGIFREAYNVLGGIERVIPVDVFVPGCSPKPEAIMDGILMAVGLLDEKARQMKVNIGTETKETNEEVAQEEEYYRQIDRVVASYLEDDHDRIIGYTRRDGDETPR